MKRRQVVVYAVIPVLLSAVLMGMYFSGNLVLQRIVSPKLPPLSPDAWREFGLLETLQHLTLLLMTGVAFMGVIRKRRPVERAVWLFVAACILFVLLEQVDYGAHFQAYWSNEGDFHWFLPMADWPPALMLETDWTAAPTNIHNQAGLDKLFKKAGNVLLFGLFVVLPLVAMRVRNRWVTYIAPSSYAILSIVAMVLLRYVVHRLGHIEESAVEAAHAAGNTLRELGSVSKNLSEFRELNCYYLLLVYLVDIVFFHRRSAEAPEAAEADADGAAA